MKKTILTGVAAAALVLFSCGETTSPEELEAQATEISEVQEEVDALETELEELKEAEDDLESSLDDL